MWRRRGWATGDEEVDGVLGGVGKRHAYSGAVRVGPVDVEPGGKGWERSRVGAIVLYDHCRARRNDRARGEHKRAECAPATDVQRRGRDVRELDRVDSAG